MNVSLIVIGDELLNGQVIDTNSGVLERLLLPRGFQIDSVRVIHDNETAIIKAVRDELSKVDIVITSGGLGPTRDDITKKALMQIFGGELIENEEVVENIKDIFQKRGKELNQLTLDQALVPTSCTVRQNYYGTAPVMMFEKNNKILLALPGVPHEFEGCCKDIVVPEIKNRFKPHDIFFQRTFIVGGITESALAIRLSKFEDELPQSLHLAYLPQRGYIKLRLDGSDTDEIDLIKDFQKATQRLLEELDDILLGVGDDSLQEILCSRLKLHQFTVATAESCTGGRIASAITAVPGSSSVFRGGVVAYSNDVKESVLGVNVETLSRFGAVSAKTVEEMATGVMKTCGSDFAVATSGIAGPAGGSPEKPVGTVWFAISGPSGVFSFVRHFTGDRQRVMESAVNEALLTLIMQIKNYRKDS